MSCGLAMGNENSVLDKCELSEKYVEVNNWRAYRGTYVHEPGSDEKIPITLFEKQLGKTACKHEEKLCNNAAKCLKIYRHPSIVKFHADGQKSNGDIFMVTEQVEPLSSLFQKMSALEICSGLQSIMTALSFCHETCNLRHNNFGITSIFVTLNGCWKLAGMEFACSFQDYTEEFRQKSRSFRNEAVIPPEENNEGRSENSVGHAGDVYALGLLIETLLESIVKSGSLFGAQEFLDLVKKDVLVSDPAKRPTVSKLLEHSMFQNEFLNICTFLNQITLKSDSEKQVFFCNLASILRQLPEELVASRLVELLLSRFVLMDPHADKYFLPDFLRPLKDGQATPIISLDLYKEYVIPNLVRIFKVHDRIIRRVLLTYFEHYVALFERNILKERILPEVLLGVKDTNNILVVLSLKALACLVPLLGSDVVVGGQRQQYFSESIPKKRETVSETALVVPKLHSVEDTANHSSGQIGRHLTTEHVREMEDVADDEIIIPEIERSSPDGSESSRCQVTRSVEDSDWLDWDSPAINNDDQSVQISNDPTAEINNVDISTENSSTNSTEGIKSKKKTLGEEFDIMALEIKNQNSGELDFFADMQPKISSNETTNVQSYVEPLEEVKPKISFAVVYDEEVADGWDDV